MRARRVAGSRVPWSSPRSNGSGRRGRYAITTASAAIVWRAQQAKSYTLSGNHAGSRTTSAGTAGTHSHGQAPNSASHRWVNTRAFSRPPARRTNAAAAAMCAASGPSPARRSATYASTVVDTSPGPPRKFAHEPSSRWLARIHRADRSVVSASRIPRNSRSNRSSASIVTLVSSSPFHHPSRCCSDSRCSRARSIAVVASTLPTGAASAIVTPVPISSPT